MREVFSETSKKDKPKIELTVRRVEPSVWTNLKFDKHHYLTAVLNPACKCLLFEWGDEPVAFAGLINTPRKGIPYGMAISRIVIMPDYQGLGLSTKLCNFLGGIVKSLSDEEHDYKLYIKTAHSKMSQGLSRNPNWKGTQFDGKTRTTNSTESEGAKYKNRLVRRSACKEYIGEPIYGYEDMLKPISEMRKLKMTM